MNFSWDEAEQHLPHTGRLSWQAPDCCCCCCCCWVECWCVLPSGWTFQPSYLPIYENVLHMVRVCGHLTLPRGIHSEKSSWPALCPMGGERLKNRWLKALLSKPVDPHLVSSIHVKILALLISNTNVQRWKPEDTHPPASPSLNLLGQSV